MQVEKPETVDTQDWCDFIQACKNRRKPLTASRWKGIMDEAEKAGLQIAEVVALCARNGWASYRADYNVTPQQNGARQFKTAREIDDERAADLWNAVTCGRMGAKKEAAKIIDVSATYREPLQLLEKTG